MGAAGVVGCGTLVAWAAALTLVDVRHRRLPNVLTLTGAVVILAGAAATGRGTPALVGGLALGGLYLMVHLADPSGMGAGDVKLALALGALTGAFGIAVWTLAALAAPMLTAILGVAAVVRRQRILLPHGPSMCAASLASAALAVF
jgi:leader peptidase (prepilin peptidase)/N-methyltransferase